MGLRVHELARELKISTTALKKHLSDLGIKVKSHMSIVDEDVVKKIRAKFNEQISAQKEIANKRKQYYERRKKIIMAKEKEKREKLRKKKEAERKRAQEKKRKEKEEKRKEEERKRKERERLEVRKRIEKEKEEKKKKEKKSRKSKIEFKKVYDKSSQKPPQKRKKQPPKRKKQSDKELKKKVLKKPPIAATPPTEPPKKTKKTQKKEGDFSDKSKHIKAKLKHAFKRKKRKHKNFFPNEKEEAIISKNIKKTLSKPKKKKKYKKDHKKDDSDEPKKIVINEFTSVNELSKLMEVSPSEIIKKFFNLGKMVTMNQRLDKDSLEMICDEFNFDVSFQKEYGEKIIKKEKEKYKGKEKSSRPPIVTVMGHVDHGKTSILDQIRSTNIIAGESGGITQHIGAYQITYNEEKISFLDTPGHEAFTAMRARGANITDFAVIVIAANEGVMPTTIEAIDHARAAGVEIIVAINKVDLPHADVNRTLSQLAEHNILVEGWGGDILWVKCSAKTGEGLDELLDTILLAAEMKELESYVDVPAKAIVIEAKKDPRLGTTCTILMKEGTLDVGDTIVCGATFGKIRKMEDERGNEIENTLEPADVAVIYGLNDVPKSGDILNTVENEKTARRISSERSHIRQERERFKTQTKLSNLFQKIKESEMAELKLIIKADTDGSLGALRDSFEKLSTNEVAVNIIHSHVGGVSQRDVNLAAASDAIIIGFHVRASTQASKLAEEESVEIKNYDIIYNAIADVKNALSGMLSPDYEDKFVGTAEVKQVFKIKNIGKIAGCAVVKGSIRNDCKLRLFRDDIKIYEGEVSSLKHYQQDVAKVKAGTDCGIGIKGYNDIKKGDVIEAYEVVEIKREL